MCDLHDPFPSVDLIILPCGNTYCTGCLRSHFTTAVRDEFVFPPRCCGKDIPFALISQHLSQAESDAYHRAAAEFTATKRIYCAAPRCSSFIPAANITKNLARYPDCRAWTCTECSNLEHRGACAENAELEQMMELARLNDWRRCSRCGTMVERTEGCNHMK